MASLTTAKIIASVAAELIKRYNKEGSGISSAQIPTKPEITNVLETLIKADVLQIGRTKEVNDELIERVQLAVKKLEQFAGAQLDVDGLIDKSLVGFLVERCLGNPHFNRTNLKPNTTTRQHIEGKIRYFVDGNLPDISGVDDPIDIVDTAFISWQKVAFIPVTEAGTKEGANFLITTVSIDGNGNTLADATLGAGPGSGLLEMRIDLSEEWDANKFEGTVCHEIGHALGLDHSSDRNDLMFPRYQPHIKTPQPNDIARIQRLWGLPEVPTDLPPRRGGSNGGAGVG